MRADYVRISGSLILEISFVVFVNYIHMLRQFVHPAMLNSQVWRSDGKLSTCALSFLMPVR